MSVLKPVFIKKRGNSYSLNFYAPNGERRRLSIGKDSNYAERMKIKFTDWLLEGKDPETEYNIAKMQEEARSKTICDLFPIFMERHGFKQSIKMQELYKNCFKNICRCPNIVNKPITSITRGQVSEYMFQRMEKDNVKAATVNREASFLRCMFSRAVDWEILKVNPLNGLKLFKEADKREVNLSLEQVESLISLLKEPMSSIVEFAIYSGFRKENILGLKIESIRFYDIGNRGEVDMVTKGNKCGIFPLGSNAVDLLKRFIGNRKTGYVFVNPITGNRYSCIHSTFDRAVKKLDLKVGRTKLRFHDLRHIFATWLHREGVSLDILRSLLGHSDRSTTDRYASIDRIECGKFLSVQPKIRKKQA